MNDFSCILATHVRSACSWEAILALTLGTPVEGYHEHRAKISMLLSACSNGGLEEPKGYDTATVRTLCVSAAGACHSAGT
jgi:hypothetical protein